MIHSQFPLLLAVFLLLANLLMSETFQGRNVNQPGIYPAAAKLATGTGETGATLFHYTFTNLCDTVIAGIHGEEKDFRNPSANSRPKAIFA